MILRAIAAFCFTACCAYPHQADCIAVDADQILARDLAGRVGAFAKLPAESLLAPAPAPGATRTFHAAELLSLAQRNHLELEAAMDVCFQRAMEPLNREKVLAAMQESLQLSGARIEIAEMSAYPVPRGKLEFLRNRLGTPAAPLQPAPVLWRGDIVYGADHRFAIWARVNIVARSTKIVAIENLKPGQPIESRQLRAEAVVGFPPPGKLVGSLDQLVGLIPVRPVAAGLEIRMDSVTEPRAVNLGDIVEVQVLSGSMRLSFTGKAEAAGSPGETIQIRNPDSHKLFPARVTGKGQVMVQSGWTKGN